MKRAILNLSVYLIFSVVFFACVVTSALAKYCPQCGKYNQDANKFCQDCGFNFSKQVKKMKVGVLLVSSVHPGVNGKFTIYHKSDLTPFYVWNKDGNNEIGEVRLPVLEDISFVAMNERYPPSLSDIKALGKKYDIDKLMVFNYNAKETERMPIFSSQSYDIFLDVTTYDALKGSVLQEKRYKESLKSWPDITVTQVKNACAKLWNEMIPNIRILLK